MGFPPEEAFESILGIGHYVLGSALEYQAEAARGISAERDAALAARIRDTAELPHLAAVLARPRADPHAAFRRGLDLFICGLRARHRELVGVAPADAVDS